MGDTGLRRYSYEPETPALQEPLFPRLLSQLPSTLPGDMVEPPEGHPIQTRNNRLFQCPADALWQVESFTGVSQSMNFVAYDVGTSRYNIQANAATSFAMNGSVFGFHHLMPSDQRALRGQLAAVADPSRRLMLGDAMINDNVPT